MKFEDLNKDQLAAVNEIEGKIRVIAGAGSGKTKVLTSRYINLVDNIGIQPKNILCTTFTNKAAAEMRRRIRRLIGGKDLAYITTFHGLCVKILRQDGHKVHVPKGFDILDKPAQRETIKTVFEKLGLRTEDFTYSEALDAIKKYKYEIEELYVELMQEDNVEELEENRNTEDLYVRMFYQYVYEQRKAEALDYDDLMIFASYLLGHDKEVREKWQFQYIMVDEYQDINKTQKRLIRYLSERDRNVFIVGDPDQTIYSFRGSNIENILKFKATSDFQLNLDYRSTKEVIDVANTVIANNKDRVERNLVPVKENPGKAIYYHAQTYKEEAEWVASEIQEMISNGVKATDIAILYRNRKLSTQIENIFIQNKIPFVKYDGVAFYEQKEVRDLFSYLKLIRKDDDKALLRCIATPSRGFGKKKIESLKNTAYRNNFSFYETLKYFVKTGKMKQEKIVQFVEMIEEFRSHPDMEIGELFTQLMIKSGYEAEVRIIGDNDKDDILTTLKQQISLMEKSYGEPVTLQMYLDEMSLYTDADTESTKEGVRLMTIHAAKGLEFKNVFVIGMNEGIFPSAKTVTRAQMEEERRLAYVAITRAEDNLYLSEAEGNEPGRGFAFPSRFIFEAKDTIEYVNELPEELVEKAFKRIDEVDATIENLENLSAGTWIHHEVFGDGEILSINQDNVEIKFENIDTPRILRTSKRLQKISRIR